jgi:hypothetical protein
MSTSPADSRRAGSTSISLAVAAFVALAMTQG